MLFLNPDGIHRIILRYELYRCLSRINGDWCVHLLLVGDTEQIYISSHTDGFHDFILIATVFVGFASELFETASELSLNYTDFSLSLFSALSPTWTFERNPLTFYH